MKHPVNSAKVLLVDDDPQILRLLSHWLKQAGYEVQVAEDGLRALQSIERECPDFLITDWLMPNINGLELCRQIRQLQLPHYVYTVILSGKSSASELITGLENGADEYLCKPVSQGELLARLWAGARFLEQERRLNTLAHTDGLTGLMTQRSFYDILQKEWRRAKRLQLPLSCVMLDLDFFKRINDIYGHPVGDSMLKSVADLLLTLSRASDSVCRYGGDEYCVLLPETTEEAAVAWVERVRMALALARINTENEGLRTTCSFGVAQCYEDTQTPEELLNQADQALLCAKRTGRDCVIRYQSLNESGDLKIENSPQADLFDGIKARHVMPLLGVCLREHDTIGQAAEFFLRTRVNSAPVVNAQAKLVGVLSEKDLMMSMISLDYWQLPVCNVMKSNVIIYEENTPIRTIYEFLCRVSIRRVVIVKDGRPTGSISRATLLRWFRNLVISKGLMKHEYVQLLDSESDSHDSRERLAETVRKIIRQAAELLWHFENNCEDLVPRIVGGTTGMQELLYDLLAFSRYANVDGNVDLNPQSMLTEGSYVD